LLGPYCEHNYKHFLFNITLLLFKRFFSLTSTFFTSMGRKSDNRGCIKES